MSETSKILPEALRSRDSATFTGSYQTLGTALAHPSVLIKIVNNSGVDVTISWDGVSDHDFIPDGSFALYDIQTNHDIYGKLKIAQSTQFYVKGSASTGSVYLMSLYNVEHP